jgi:hypothetical protein
MGKLADFDLEELGFFITLLMGSCGGLMAIIFKSRCSKIRCCGAEIQREVIPTKDATEEDKQSEEKKTENTSSTVPTSPDVSEAGP